MTKIPTRWLLYMLLVAFVLITITKTEKPDEKEHRKIRNITNRNSNTKRLKRVSEKLTEIFKYSYQKLPTDKAKNEETKKKEDNKIQNESRQISEKIKCGKFKEKIKNKAVKKKLESSKHERIRLRILANKQKCATTENHIKARMLPKQYRMKREQKPTKNLKPLNQHKVEHNFNLPSVPLPTPPPFPKNFALNSFSGFGIDSSNDQKSPTAQNFLNAITYSEHTPKESSASYGNHKTATFCGGIFKARRGIIKTPNFPHKFQIPIECVWIIDASELPTMSSGANITIVVYLTQLYVLGGLKFTEYMYYSDDYKVPAHRIFTLTEDDVTQATWIQFHSQYLEIRFTMSTLDGTHLRALDRLLDVYGFNITYEVQDQVKPYQCNTLQCRFLGHCYAKFDFSSYYCACFPGFSGTDCGRGPLCEDPHTNICQNGGTCKHIGDAAITCHCPIGFKGTKCEIPEINERTMGCTANSTSADCHSECNFEHSYDSNSLFKSRKSAARKDKTRYEVTIRLGTNLTTFHRNADLDRKSSDHLPGLLERHLTRVLRNFNITKISDLELISNGTERLDITFHFFGINSDSNRIREAITRMVERGRIGNITLVSNYHIFDENPPLDLMELTVNHKAVIREGSEFILSCTAQGSSRMQFQWFKDGAIVNASKATREIWTTVLPPETRDTFTAILGVTKASRTDEGIYTCKVTDWGIEQCRSTHIHIKSAPRLRVDPASVTLQRGDSLRVRCLSPGNDDIKRYAQLGYSWTRNGNLFQSDPRTVMWEDLYPDGSILKINNIQSSAEYTCIVSNTVKPVSKSVYITVIDRNAVHVCHAEILYGVHWPTSAPGAAIISDCPRGFEGHSRRICEKHDAGNSSWLLPDFSLCIHDQLLMIYDDYHTLAAGFQISNSTTILKACFDYTIKRFKNFLRGEAGFLIDMLHEVDSYLQLKGTQLEREMAAEIILYILDKVLQNPQSLNSQQQIKKLQLLTQSAALNRETIAASQLATSTSSSSSSLAGNILQPSNNELQDATSSASAASSTQTAKTTTTAANGGGRHQATAAAATSTLLKSVIVADGHGDDGGLGGTLTVDEESLSLDRLSSLRIYMTSVRTLPFNLRIYGDDLFTDQLYMDIGLTSRLSNIMANSTIFASVISYKNLKMFLPKTYYTRGSDPKETDYILASRIIQTWLFQSNRSNDNFREPLELPFEAGHVEIIFQHESPPKNSDWIAVCGHDYKASFESTWRSDLCITKHLMENITRCICPLSGTYVVILTRKQFNHSALQNPSQSPIFIIISCGCCFLQTCSAFLILLPIWFNRKCAITFLKMQFCISTSSIMLIFLLGFLKMLPMHWQAVISSSLASLLLLGISTLIAIALVIHTESVPKKYLHINKSSETSRETVTATAASTLPRKGPTALLAQQEKRRNSTSAGMTITSSDISLSGLTNITQISNTDNDCGSMSPKHANKTNNLMPKSHLNASSVSGIPTYQLPPSGICAAIGISWLLPLLFAIASPLICSIIGKWPNNWWLEIMSTTLTPSTTIDDVEGYNGDVASNGGGLGYFTSGYIPILETKTSLHNVDHHLHETIQQNTTTTNAISLNSQPTIATTTAISSPISESSNSERHMNTMETTLSSTPFLTPWRAVYNHASEHISTPHYQTTINGNNNNDGNYNNKALSLSFIIFICVDFLFIFLFVALFVILIKKLMLLRRSKYQKNQSGTAVSHQLPHHHHHHHRNHHLDKFSLELKRRLGLLCRTGCLLLIKLCTDGLFLAYMNTSQNELLKYPFGLSCILLGSTILCCFIIKPECSLRDQRNGFSGTNKSSKMAKKMSSSKTSLDDNYCTNTINSPLSYYVKEKECESSAPTSHLAALLANSPSPQQIDISSCGNVPGNAVQLPLTIISTAPSRCQMLTASGLHEFTPPTGSSVETFLGPMANKLGAMPPHLAGSIASSPASRCCSIIGNMVNATPASQTPGNTIGYYDASASYALSGGLPISITTGSLSRQQRAATHHQLQQQAQQQQQLEFGGAETLDILQGLTADNIIGLRSNNILSATSANATTPNYQLAQQQQHHMPFVDSNAVHVSAIPIVATLNYTNTPSITSNNNPIINPTNTTTIATNSVMTQTPKSQKRVTIMEPTTHTFDPMLPTMIAVSGVPTTATSQLLATSMSTIPTPIITITSTTTCSDNDVVVSCKTNAENIETPTSDSSSSNDGSVFDRITHDLDYLLNRTNEAPDGNDDENDAILPPPPPTICVQINNATTNSSSSTCSQISTTSSLASTSTASSCPSSSSTVTGRTITQHAVIIEETEVQL